MTRPPKILLQTTIPTTDDDWRIERFSMLRDHLAGLRDADGAPAFEVVARDRGPMGAPDPVLSTLDTSDFDQLWLFAVDTGEGLTAEDCGGISRFRARGGAMMVTRDHFDLGKSVCSLGGVGAAHFFHNKNPDPDESRRCRDDQITTDIDWPNYHSGANGDFQPVTAVGARHPILEGVDFLPSHPHEGAVGKPAGDDTARVVATGRSQASGRDFNLAVAFERADGNGPAVAQSTFHHFADYNWDPSRGCPSFVTEAPGNGLARSVEARTSIRRYAQNLATWLGRRG